MNLWYPRSSLISCISCTNIYVLASSDRYINFCEQERLDLKFFKYIIIIIYSLHKIPGSTHRANVPQQSKLLQEPAPTPLHSSFSKPVSHLTHRFSDPTSTLCIFCGLMDPNQVVSITKVKFGENGDSLERIESRVHAFLPCY